MKKEDLKASLDRIRPREELVASTLAKIREQRAKEERRHFVPSPVYARGLRVAGAFCAFALVFCIGFAVARQGGADPSVDTPDVRLAGELDTSVGNVSGADVARFSLNEEGEWTVVRGTVESIRFAPLTEEDVAMGATSRATVKLYVESVESSSESLSRDTISTAVETELLFYDTESLNSFVELMSGEMLFKLVPAGEDGWEIEDFSAAVK